MIRTIRKGAAAMEPITEALLAWYDRNARVLPWRGIHDAYRTWVSEAMLQQTRVETVLPYYKRFLDRFPTLQALAGASEEEVLKEWEGLGYYSRARNLWTGAREVISRFGGVLPEDPAVLQTIRGIGPYTAGAVASIAYDVPVPAVDGNVIRVLSRLYGIRDDASSPEILRLIHGKAAALVPAERPGDHNQAVMDLGATVCVPGTPDCASCPLSCFCDANRKGDAADLPRLPKAKPPRTLCWSVLLIRCSGRVLMRCRTEKLLQGMWCFPMIEGFFTEEELSGHLCRKGFPSSGLPAALGSCRHVFTHQIWEMQIYETSAAADAAAPKGYEFIPETELNALPIPAAMSGALSALRR